MNQETCFTKSLNYYLHQQPLKTPIIKQHTEMLMLTTIAILVSPKSVMLHGVFSTNCDTPFSIFKLQSRRHYNKKNVPVCVSHFNAELLNGDVINQNMFAKCSLSITFLNIKRVRLAYKS